MLNKQFLLHLSLIEGIGPITVQHILKGPHVQTNALNLYHLSASDWMHYYGFTPGVAQKLVAGLADKKILETELYLIEKHHIQLTTLLDDHYPALLREIYMPPTVLYHKGGGNSSFAKATADISAEIAADMKKHIAIVGSRASNTYGMNVVATITSELVDAGITIVSGGALGIDTIAHETTVKNGGNTIAVLGSGLLKPYPAANKKLFSAIEESGGIVMSIFPLLMEPHSGNFPARNRVISGLSHGCLVVQAAQKSGALITARYALEQGRDVFAIPGPIDDPLSAGCHSLIQQGAKLVACSADILQEIGCQYQAVRRDVQTTMFTAHAAQSQLQQLSHAALSEIQKKIIAACRQPTALDDIMVATNYDIATVQMELFTMQLDGLVEQDFAGRWMSAR